MARIFEEKVVVITGGASGIGRETAIAFSNDGACVVVADVDDAKGKETVDIIKTGSGNAIFVKCDVSKSHDTEAMVHKAVETYGRLDYAFNNAGIGVFGSTIDFAEQDWDRLININLKGVWLCMKYEIIQMLKQGGGAIVNTSSVGGLLGAPNTPAYTASKHGVMGLTKTAALEYAKNNIRINAICPGAVLTPLLDTPPGAPDLKQQLLKAHPVGRLGEAKEIAQAVIWLCSDAASFVTGTGLSIDGGVTAGRV
jgi:NAD(P)-dependent dehydrogenase (short-subunit alcohol dehydrogenase family)